jgi:hypothetical protein
MMGSSIGVEQVESIHRACLASRSAKHLIQYCTLWREQHQCLLELTEHLRSARAVFHARNRIVCAPLCFALLRTDGHAGENVRNRFIYSFEYSTGFVKISRVSDTRCLDVSLGDYRRVRCIV